MSILTDVDISHPLLVGAAAAVVVAAATTLSTSEAAAAAIRSVPQGTLMDDVIGTLKGLNAKLVPTLIIVGVATFVATVTVQHTFKRHRAAAATTGTT